MISFHSNLRGAPGRRLQIAAAEGLRRTSPFPRLSIQDLHLTKNLDVTSAELAMAVAMGHIYSKIQLVAVRAGGERPLEFLRFTLSNTLFSSVAFAGDSSVSARTETLVLKPRRVEVQYTPQNADGTLGTPITASVDCASTFF